MTGAIVKCEWCNSIVELARINRKLVLVCDCPEERKIRVNRVLPEGWQ